MLTMSIIYSQQLKKTFNLEDLAKILIVYNNEKLNTIYNKFFYGMEKEGKSAYF